MTINLCHLVKGRQLIYDAYKNQELNRHLCRGIRNYFREPNKNKKIDERLAEILEPLIKKGQPDSEMNSYNAKAFLMSKHVKTEQRNNGIDYLSELFHKINGARPFFSQTEKFAEIERKKGKLNKDIVDLQGKRKELDQACKKVFSREPPYAQSNLEEWVERLNHCHLENDEAILLRDQLIDILQAMIALDLDYLSLVDFEIFRNPAIKNFVQVNSLTENRFIDITVYEFSSIADKYEVKKDDIENLSVQIVQKEAKIQKLTVKLDTHKKALEEVARPPFGDKSTISKAPSLEPNKKKNDVKLTGFKKILFTLEGALARIRGFFVDYYNRFFRKTKKQT